VGNRDARKNRIDAAARAGENLWLAENIGMPGIPLGVFVSLIPGVRCTKWASPCIPRLKIKEEGVRIILCGGWASRRWAQEKKRIAEKNGWYF
jgi:hypothetical protein